LHLHQQSRLKNPVDVIVWLIREIDLSDQHWLVWGLYSHMNMARSSRV
jgi:hypothetical protein